MGGIFDSETATPTLSPTLSPSFAPTIFVSTPSPTAPDCCSKRCRKPWNDMEEAERSLYINGFSELAGSGVIQEMSQSHADLFSDIIHWTPLFLPWHRAFLYDLENKIRALGDEYACFAMPYWDWSDEDVPADVGVDGPIIFNSGLGNDPNNGCINDGSPFAAGSYIPQDSGFVDDNDVNCLWRDADWMINGDASCLMVQPPALMSLIDDSNGEHLLFTNNLERTPHYNPHVCLDGNMAAGNSPDDPAFYLHHAFIDYLYAVWQDCNNYDGKDTQSGSNEYAGTVSDFLPLPHNGDLKNQYTVSHMLDMTNLDVIYAKGEFWGSANVDDEANCGANNINGEWFYDAGLNRRRLRSKSQIYSQNLYKQMKESGDYETQRELKRAWSIKVCEYEQIRNYGEICEIPEYFDDCSDLPIDPITNDIVITKEELINKDGLTGCMKKTREEYHGFAAASHSLLSLCAGCFDQFCDKSQFENKCAIFNHNQRRRNGGGGGHVSDQQKTSFMDKIFNSYNNYDDNGNNNVYLSIYFIIGAIVILLICNIILMINIWCKRVVNINKSHKYKVVQFESDTESAHSESNLVS